MDSNLMREIHKTVAFGSMNDKAMRYERHIEALLVEVRRLELEAATQTKQYARLDELGCALWKLGYVRMPVVEPKQTDEIPF